MNTQSVRIAFSFILLLALQGCADSIVSDCGDPVAEPMSARFADIEQKVFAVSCATAGCHGGSNPMAGLDLSQGKAYASLVGVSSVNYPGQQRVKAGSSGESVMIGMLRGTLLPSMPPSGAIDAAVIDSIAAWIDQGAQNN